MKLKHNAWWLVPVVSLSGFSCKEKPKTVESGTEEKSMVDKVVETVKEAVTPGADSKLSAEERAAKVGFAKYLPKDTEALISVYDAKGSAEKLQALEVVGLIMANAGGMGMGAQELEMVPEDAIVPEEEMLEEDVIEVPEAEQADEPGEEAPMAEGGGPWTLLGQEVTIAMGKSTADQAGNLMTFNRRMGYLQAKAMGTAVASAAKGGDMEMVGELLQDEMGAGLLKAIIKDSESGTDLFDKTEMPPMYLAFRAKEGELEQAAQLVASGMSFFGMAGEMAAPVEFETGGVKLSGFTLLGEKVAEAMEEERENMERDLDAETVDALLRSIRSKNLTVATGTIDNYVVVVIGGDKDKLVLESEIGNSFVSTDELKFSDAFADKQLVSLMYGKKDILQQMITQSGGLSSYSIGFRDGISGSEGLGDTRDIEGLLQIIADREKALLELGSYADSGLVAFVDEGLKVESFGGYDKGALDWKAKTKLAHLGKTGDPLMFFNMASDATYDERIGGYVEAIFETAFAIAEKAAELDIDSRDMREFKEAKKMFDENFSADVVGLYDALSGPFSEGLGHEMAFVVDLGGAFPAIPGIPQAVVDEAKSPRITYIAPVEDRSKLATAWDEMNTRTTSILAKISEMSGEKIPMQKPISSEKDGMTTWFFSFPFFQDDFMPSVTVSDDWFAASTSKTRALDLMGKAKAGGAEGEGLVFHVNFNALTGYAKDTLALIDKNSAEIFPNEYKLGKFNREKGEMLEVIEACEEFDSLDWTSREENGYLRTSIHFKTK